MCNASPLGPGGNLGSVGIDLVPVELTAAGVDIYLGGAEPTFALPQVTDGPEEEDDGGGEVALEEGFGSAETRFADGGGDSSVKLSRSNQYDFFRSFKMLVTVILPVPSRQ